MKTLQHKTTENIIKLNLVTEYAMENKRPKILVVEDEPLNQKIARINLETMGYEVVIANDGFEALKKFDSSYDFILMDIGLPEMDGMEVTRRIREIELSLNSHVIIIAATAFGNSYKTPCLEAGMDDFLTKPLFEEELEAVLKKYR
ncbi:MAG: Sensor histidine kinase RcsC [Legionellaceae bacterium]